jgi:hypothetical protein
LTRTFTNKVIVMPEADVLLASPQAQELLWQARQLHDSQPVVCVACGDTGVASSGVACVPCVRSGRIK